MLRFTPLLLWLLLGCSSEPTPTPEPDPAGFPAEFLWGTASASWQVEGDYDPDPNDAFDVRSNWTVWAERGCIVDGQTNEQGSGFYTRYAEDFALAASLGTNTYRLGIDWARIEPEDDVWNEAELQHYVDVLEAAVAAGLQPMLTLHHWVVPSWIQNPTGDENEVDALTEAVGPDNRFVTEFEEFVRYVAPAVAPYVDLYPILNETFSVITVGYLNGDCGAEAFPPGGFLDLASARKVHANYLFAHAAACRALRELDTDDADGDGDAALCGAAASTNAVRPMDASSDLDVEAAERIDWIYNHAFHVALIDGDVDLDFDAAFTTTMADSNLPMDEGNYPELAGTIDWIGLNYYGPIRVTGTGGGALGGIPFVDVEDYEPSLPHSTLGFAIDATGFADIISTFEARYGLPMYVTENGLGDDEDDDRPMYLVEHLDVLQQQIAAGADVRGYYHWSLTDNFEWAHGFEQRFGLVHVDYDSPDLTRTPGASADAYSAIISAGGVTDAVRSSWVLDKYPSDGRP
ncbi:MAG: glycoside hydrolase family 1 protein [Deltaproteobacteria bacterium]|nr:glycoside hydrolase family 1 protein [Deltaproteobacteria bacterium]